MIGGVPAVASVSPESGEPPDRLAEATKQLEGVFMEYLTHALRSTVPNEGHADAPGADIYGSLLDQHLAQVLASHTKTGIAAALYRQLTDVPPDSSAEGSEQ